MSIEIVLMFCICFFQSKYRRLFSLISSRSWYVFLSWTATLASLVSYPRTHGWMIPSATWYGQKMWWNCSHRGLCITSSFLTETCWWAFLRSVFYRCLKKHRTRVFYVRYGLGCGVKCPFKACKNWEKATHNHTMPQSLIASPTFPH